MKPHKHTTKHDLSQLYKAFIAIESEVECQNFLLDLCTPAEIEAMNDRWKIARILHQGKPQRNAQAETHTGINTVARVARFLNGKHKGYLTLLNKLYPRTPAK